jgi:hypothetical protein
MLSGLRLGGNIHRHGSQLILARGPLEANYDTMPNQPPALAAQWRPGKCSVCHHQEKTRIELLSVGRASLAALADKFNVSKDSIYRHLRNHVTKDRKGELLAGPAKVEELANKAADESRSLLE